MEVREIIQRRRGKGSENRIVLWLLKVDGFTRPAEVFHFDRVIVLSLFGIIFYGIWIVNITPYILPPII